MKLRETLIDEDEKLKVTVPTGLSVFPNNKIWAALTTFALLALISGIILLVPDEKGKGKVSKNKNSCHSGK